MIERRFNSHAAKVEARADGGKSISGYAAVFYDPADPGTEYELWQNVFERIDPQAFARAIAEKHDCRGLFNHDANQILGRVAAGTCRLSVDARGLKYEIDCPDTQQAKDLCASIERGDVTGSSFSFIARKRTWMDDGEREISIIGDVDLFDVGPVTFPAYESTTSTVRSAELEQSREAWQAEKQRENRSHAAPGPKLALLRLKEKEIYSA